MRKSNFLIDQSYFIANRVYCYARAYLYKFLIFVYDIFLINLLNIHTPKTRDGIGTLVEYRSIFIIKYNTT